MSDDPRVETLLEELLSTDATPEAVCSACVELLPVVRERWRQVVRTRAELNAMFPSEADSTSEQSDIFSDNDSFPDVPGYEIEAVLGTGGMGVVFRARHLRLNRTVALKMALAGAYAGQRDRERFQREAESIAALRHPNVVQIHDVGDTFGQPYFTMEYVDGGSLAEKLVVTPLTILEAAALAASLAAAVHAAHASGIVHRDLKPGNVLLTADGTAKISDFGLALRFVGDAALTRTGAALGTPSYMAPEQACSAAGAIGPPADIYALGAMLYEMLTGRPPFRAESGAETVNQLLTQDPAPPSRLNGSVPRELEIICLKCLSKEPSRRYSGADALGEDLNRFLRGDAILARPEGRVRRTMRAVRRRPALFVALAAGVLCTLTFLAVLSWALFDRAVTERAVANDLDEIDAHLQKSAFPEARAAIGRAEARLGAREARRLREQLHMRMSECELADQLERINLDSAAALDGMTSFAKADQDFDEAFHEFGLRRPGDDPETVAGRIRDSRIRMTLLAALDRWSVVAMTGKRLEWTMKVADGVEPKPTQWRKDARSPDVRRNRTALLGLIDRADVQGESIALLLAINSALKLQDSERVMPFLMKVQRAHPDDLWANIQLGYANFLGHRPDEAIRYFQTVVALRPRLSIGHYSLGLALDASGSPRRPERYDEAILHFRKALEIEPNSGMANFSLFDALVTAGKHSEVIPHVQDILRFNHQTAKLRSKLGISLKAVGRIDESFEQFRLAFSLEPNNRQVQDDYRKALAQERRWIELQQVWRITLEGERPIHADWYGYAELCLYLGQTDEYHLARTALLRQFEKSDSPQTAERTARAALLLPAPDQELSIAVSLAERAEQADRKQAGPLYPYYQFAKGIAEYRQGRFDRAIAVMRGDASRMPGPLPQLVLAMALFETKQETEARKVFASAMLNHDWREPLAISPDGWIRHVLRREAERMILPNLDALVGGRHQPRNADERLGMIGVCRFENRFAALSHIYSEAFAADPRLAANHRLAAARAAVQAGCGGGMDADRHGEPERKRWRAQAMAWMREDLCVQREALEREFNHIRERVRQSLTGWLNDPDLAGIREPAELEKLPPAEREEYQRFWTEAISVLDSTSKHM